MMYVHATKTVLPIRSPLAWMLRAEGVFLFAGMIWAYANYSGNWLMFMLLLAAPDLSLLGYRAGKQTGNLIYNLCHTCSMPGLLAVYGLAIGNPLIVSLALIWLAHIGMDRMIGLTLKDETP